jgi:ankyrin repeat protein
MDEQFNELHRIMEKGDVIGLRHALEAGLDPNLRNRFGWTLLMIAALLKNTALLRLLLQFGADVNAMNDFGGSALDCAAGKGSHSAVAVLLRAGASVRRAWPQWPVAMSNQRVFDLLAEAERNEPPADGVEESS